MSDGVVAEKMFVEQLETDADHGEETLDEDDDFLGSAAPEIWEYEVVDARVAEFEEALKNSDLVLEYDVVDTEATTAEDSPAGVLGDGGVYPSERESEAAAPQPGSSSAGSPSAGSSDEEAELVYSNSGGIDDLNVVKANDPRLGLTNRGTHPAQDWAADTGPTRNPNQTIEGDTTTDKSSTLGSRKRKKARQ